MAVTSVDVEKVIDGNRIEIYIPYPLNDRGEDAKWYMRQPTDWVYDMSVGVQEAAEAQLYAMPEIDMARALPPSEYWMSIWKMRNEAIGEAIKGYEERAGQLTPEEEIDFAMQRDALENMANPALFTRADEIVRRDATRMRDIWLMPRLIEDENGKLLFDPSTKEGRERWDKLGRKAKDEMRTTLGVVMSLVQIAKN